MRLLLVEDSDTLRRALEEGLRRSGFAVDAVDNGKQALIHAQTSEYDVIVLDIMLPQVDGLTALRQMRSKGMQTPILLLTARAAIDDRVLGLRSGADDYLTKPFAFEELVARVQALARRACGANEPRIEVGGLVVDTATRTASYAGRLIPLAPREYALLEHLAYRRGRPVRRLELEEHLYDDLNRVNSNAVDVAVCAVRAKLAAVGCPRVLRTRRGFGYVLEEVAE